MPKAGPGVVVYGIPNCDQVRAARSWLDAHQLEYHFHDFRRDGLDAARIAHWLTAHDWAVLANRRGTTWRTMPDDERPSDARSATRAFLAHPTLIKRPVLEKGKLVLVGFSQADYQQLLPA
jgi:arsenate reductase (glutaredoxin)